MNSKFLYNNEAIALVAILSVLNEKKEVDYAKVFLILPFLLNDEILKRLNRTDCVIVGLADFINKNIGLLSNFNEVYISYAPLTLSALNLARDLELIELTAGNIYITESGKGLIDNNEDLGNRAKAIIKSTPNFIKVIQTKSSNLYFSLSIQL